MATMTKTSSSVNALGRIVRKEMRGELAAGERPKPAYVLRRDGDTDTFRAVGGRVVHERVSGHVTLGMVVNPADLPCIIS